MNEQSYTLELIGFVRSELASREAAPLQGDEGAPEAWLELTTRVAQGLAGIAAGAAMCFRFTRAAGSTRR